MLDFVIHPASSMFNCGPTLRNYKNRTVALGLLQRTRLGACPDMAVS